MWCPSQVRKTDLSCITQEVRQRGQLLSDPLIISNIQAVKFMRVALVFVHKLAPIKLDLLSWFGLIALNRRVPSHRRPQGVDIFFQDTDPSGIAQRLQAREENLTIRAMVFHDPFLDLLFVWIKLGRPGRTWFRDHRFRMLEIFAHGRTRDAQLLSDLLH